MRYDAEKRWASRYGLARVIEATSIDDAEQRLREYEQGWTVTVSKCRPATQAERDQQSWIEMWLTNLKYGRLEDNQRLRGRR